MNIMNMALESVRLLVSSPTNYATRLARNMDEIRASQSLRFQVFNLELNEGLEESYATGLDEDPFDACSRCVEFCGPLRFPPGRRGDCGASVVADSYQSSASADIWD